MRYCNFWGGTLKQTKDPTPAVPAILRADGSGEHQYAILAIGPQGRRMAVSPIVKAKSLSQLRWDSVNGADAYIVIRDGKEITGPLRIEGSQKEWTDQTAPGRFPSTNRLEGDMERHQSRSFNGWNFQDFSDRARKTWQAILSATVSDYQ